LKALCARTISYRNARGAVYSGHIPIYT